MSEHVRLRHLADRRDGRLGAVRASAVEGHLASGCAECARTAHRLDAALTALAEGPLPAPPRAAVRDAVRMFRKAKWAQLLATPARLMAQLVFDQRLEVVPALRSAGGATRRMLWNIGRHELDACVVERGTENDLIGQVLPADDDGATLVDGAVQLYRDGRAVARATLDGEGRFSFENIERGTYALVGRVAREEFVVAPIAIG